VVLPQKTEVVKSNALIEATYRLSVMEQRIILSCLKLIDSRVPITDDIMYEIRVSDIAKLAGKSRNSLYEEVKDAAMRLYRREVFILKKPNGNGKHKNVLLTRWVQSVKYTDESATISLRFAKDILPYISDLRKEFTKYTLSDISKFDSAYSIRLYELMRQYRVKGKREIELNELREMFQIGDKYKVTKDFKRYIIDIAIKDINSKTSLKIAYEQIKTGRKITGFCFRIIEKEEPKTITSTKPNKPRLTKAYLEKHARPGESWDQTRERLRRELEKQDGDRCRIT
jgi:plasmid replication initiation protein